MTPIICQNDLKVVLNQLQEFLQKGGIIGSMVVVDQNEEQVVVLVDDKPITEKTAAIWWSGYLACLESFK